MNEAIARAATKMGSTAATNTDYVTNKYHEYDRSIGSQQTRRAYPHLGLCSVDGDEEESEESEEFICSRMQPNGPITIVKGNVKIEVGRGVYRSLTR